MGLVAPQFNSILAGMYFPNTFSFALKNNRSLCSGLSVVLVLPNPLETRSVWLSVSTNFVSGFLICSSIRCAILSPVVT